MNSSTLNHPTNSRDMKLWSIPNLFRYLWSLDSISTLKKFQSGKEKPISLESDEPLKFNIKTLIVFEYIQDKQNLTLNEFDVKITYFIEELESINVTIFSRSIGHKWNTVELGVIAPERTITTELIRFYSKGFKNLGVNKILISGLPRHNMSISI